MHNPDQKKFFTTKEMSNLLDPPPRPQESDVLETENLPQKRKRNDKMIEMVLACDIKKYDESEVMQNADSCRQGEIYRMKMHAQE